MGKYMQVMFERRKEGGKYVPDLKKIPETVSIINTGLRIWGTSITAVDPRVRLTSCSQWRRRRSRGKRRIGCSS